MINFFGNKTYPDPSCKVSVIMPAYNAERTIAEAVQSVLQQTFSDLELIVCNDASTDKTSSMLATILDKRLIIINNDFNIGPGLSRDKAIAVAHGEIIAFIDSDDTWMPERLEILLKECVKSNNTMIFDDMMECHDTPSGLVPWRSVRGPKVFDGNGQDAIDVPAEKYIFSKRLVIQPLIPISFIHQHNVKHTNLSFAEDTEYFLGLMSKGMKLRYVPHQLYYYRITPGSATAQQNRATMMLHVLENALDNFMNNPSVQSALLSKIKMVHRENEYAAFIHSLKHKDMIHALRMAVKSSWLIPEFIKRAAGEIPYHAHRIRHGGRIRGNK